MKNKKGWLINPKDLYLFRFSSQLQWYYMPV